MSATDAGSSRASKVATVVAVVLGLAALGLAVTISTRTEDTAAALIAVVHGEDEPVVATVEVEEPQLRGGGGVERDDRVERLRRRLGDAAVLDERNLRRILIEFGPIGTGSPDAGPWLVETLTRLASADTEQDATVRRAAVALLGRVDRALLVTEPFERLFEDPDPAIRAEAVRGRARHGLDGYVVAAVGLAHDPEPSVRVAVAEALGTFADETGSKALLRMLGDADRNVVRAAAVSLRRTWRGPLPEELVAAAGSDDANARLGAAVALRDMRGEASTRLLTRLCTDDDWQVREAAVEALGRSRSSSADAAAKRLADVAVDEEAPRDDRFEALQALVRLGDRAADPRISDVAVTSPDPLIRVMACRTALAHGDAGVLDAVVDLLDVRKGPLCDDEDMQFIHRVARETLRDVTGSRSDATDTRSWASEVIAFRARSAGSVPDYTPEHLDSFR